MNHAARGEKALAASPVDGATAVVEYTLALLQHPQSNNYLTQRSKAFTRIRPTRYDLALEDADLAVAIARSKQKSREQIQAAQHKRVVALFGLGRYQDAGFILQTMERWRSQKNTSGIGDPSKASNSDLAEAGIWKMKIEGKLKNMTEEEKQKVTVVEYPVVQIPGEAQMKAVLRKQLNADGTFNYDGTAQPDGNQNGTKPASFAKPLAQLTAASTTDPTTSVLPAKIRHEYYQNNESVILTIYAKGVPKDDAEIDIQDDSLSISFPHPFNPSTTFSFTIDPLFALVDPSASKASTMSTKVEITLKKRVPGQKWPGLEGTEPLKLASDPSNSAATAKAAVMSTLTSSAAASTGAPSYPTSSRTGSKDWDKVATDLTMEERKSRPKTKNKVVGSPESGSGSEQEGDPEYDSDEFGGDAVDGFFKKLYKGADDDTRRAMMKSFQESNGTSLSTNWNEVGKGRVDEVKSKDD